MITRRTQATANLLQFEKKESKGELAIRKWNSKKMFFSIRDFSKLDPFFKIHCKMSKNLRPKSKISLHFLKSTQWFIPKIRPQSVVELVQSFREEFLADEYLTIHWRYNKGDWYHGGCQKGKEMCRLFSVWKNSNCPKALKSAN